MSMKQSKFVTISIVQTYCICFSEELDVSGLTLHQAKRLEMDCQVKVLELEASLQQERQRLAALRRQHYQLAGDVEGWEIMVCFL